MALSDLEKVLGRALLEHPARHSYRYDEQACRDLIELFFRSMAGFKDEYLQLLFPLGLSDKRWRLSEAQGAEEGAEYTEAARGKRCGHSFRAGEASYRCMTCSTDETCALCSRCFDASDHTGHKYIITISTGHTGCCDCGDEEAFRIPVNCAIHTATGEPVDKRQCPVQLPLEFVDSIQMTISRVLDYFCDVVSCSPEQLRLPKTEDGIKQDEATSRLSAEWYCGSDTVEEEPEFALALWNDEKHTIHEVQNQVARACRERLSFGKMIADQTNDIGRSVVKYSKDLQHLLGVSKIIEHIRVTVTIRSSRDAYREQMCGTIIEWLSDIAGCHVANDNDIVRQTICSQLLQPWRAGSSASNAGIGLRGIDDHARFDGRRLVRTVTLSVNPQTQVLAEINPQDEDEEGTGEDAVEGNGTEAGETQEHAVAVAVETMAEMEQFQEGLHHLVAAINGPMVPPEDQDVDMDAGDELEAAEATLAGYPPPPPPPPPPANQDPNTEQLARDGDTNQTSSLRIASMISDGDDLGGPEPSAKLKIPQTPGVVPNPFPKAPSYWLAKPPRYNERRDIRPHEDIRRRTRLDWFILFDLRLWKKARTDFRELCLGTVVAIPEFKRILGLRFSALYPALAELYLIADREPDHSIINLSLQLLTTPSITEETVERGNFLTNLMAILYTFLTARQVGEPHAVNPTATLSLDSGSVASRRLYHFFLDMKYLLPSPYVQSRIRSERQYLLQFLDLVKLPQGMCPNVRAVGEHVEYETDSWISASLLMREINRICRMFGEAFRVSAPGESESNLPDAIIDAATSAMVNSVGLERRRFDQAEIKDEVRFKHVQFTEFEENVYSSPGYHLVVDFVVEKGSLSFHHALHYTLSWLIECGKGMPCEKLREALVRATSRVKSTSVTLDADDVLLAMFDFPLRLCAWLAQMKAGMWVRNGLSLRHQMGQYRSVQTRDVAYCRDIFMLQTALVICNPSRVLASMADRFGITDWIKGGYVTRPGYEDPQHVEILEDFVHLLIILITERASLIPVDDESTAHGDIIRKDIAHALCFKPLSFTDLAYRVSDKEVESDNFNDILEEVATFRPPDGLNDTGIFELKKEYVDRIDPYSAQFTKNQRDEAETIYKQWVAENTGRDAVDIVFEPRLQSITSGTYTGLSDFTRTPLFAHIIHHCLDYCLVFKYCTPIIAATRIEAFLHLVLHLILLATMEDGAAEYQFRPDSTPSFVLFALTLKKQTLLGSLKIIDMLQKVSNVAEFESSRPKIRHILRYFKLKCPGPYESATATLEFPYDKLESPPAENQESEQELKKQRALDRQARIMAQFQQQQKKFMDAQGDIDWGDDEELGDAQGSSSVVSPTEKKLWRYPSGTCILCQEETNDSNLYGTFAMITDSTMLRRTDLQDFGLVREVLNTPSSLDRSAENIRPFGIASENREKVRRLDSSGGEVISEKQGLSRGFPPGVATDGPVTTGCGHIMHYHCFETYSAAVHRRHTHQVARNQPERIDRKEFICPLCKALGNAFLPVIWKGKEESYPGALEVSESFENFLDKSLVYAVSRFRNRLLLLESDKLYASAYWDVFADYISKNLTTSLSSKLNQSITQQILPEPLGPSQGPRMGMPGLFPSADDSAGMQQVRRPENPAVRELVNIYKRLQETMRTNNIGQRLTFQQISTVNEDLDNMESLMTSFGFSIAAVEIAQRGVEAQPGSTLLDTIPQITLTNLRILAETAFSYAAFGAVYGDPATNRTVYEFRDMHRRKLCQLLLGHPEIAGLASLAVENKAIDPLFSVDVFVFLSECSLCLVPALNIDIHHLVRVCYVAEILKAILALSFNPQVLCHELDRGVPNDDEVMTDASGDEQVNVVRSLINWLISGYKSSAPPQAVAAASYRGSFAKTEQEEPPRYVLLQLRTLASKYALTFLRKTVLLLHAQYGVEFPNTGQDFTELSEFNRLTALLRLPSIDEIFSSFADDQAQNPMAPVVAGWIAHWNAARLDSPLESGEAMAPLPMSHPAIFELVGLPKHFDVLIEAANRKRCPTTGKELTDPSICLFCGDIFCSQAVCCSGNGKLGGCNRHVAVCGKNVGLFINIRKCAVLFLHNRNGSWQNAPYLDIHGEADPGFRHHRRLILNQKRYDRLLRDVWLSHGIPTKVGRRLEADINNGGWESI